MTEQQTQSIIQEIQARQLPIKTTIERGRVQGKHGYRLALLLVPGQRRMTVWTFEDWESIKQAWYPFLFPHEPEPVEPPPHQKYLVDGIAMTILQGKDGYWRGGYQREGKPIQKYLGREDPRGKYPVIQEVSI
jgi:hypothetical protein